MSPLYRIRRPIVVEVILALFGETPVGVVGVSLQWLTLAILAACPTLPLWLPASWHLPLSAFGIVALFAGLALAIRGKSLGPIITIPVVIGFGMMFVLVVLLYPLRLFLKDEPAEPTDAGDQSRTTPSEPD